MRSVFSFCGVLVVLVLLWAGVYGQDARFGDDPDFEPAKFVSTPRLTVPKEAIESGLGGTVRVRVSIDEAGNVTSADDANGPGAVCKSVTRDDVVAMRNAAKAAALLAKFSPATKKGKPQKSSMWLNFEYPGRPQKTDPAYTAATGYPSSDRDAGETDKPAGPKIINGGVVSGRALKLPKPPYPPAARSVRASGTVSIQVVIDESGEVFSAEAVSGHPLLRSAARAAACDARFSPTSLEGQPVKVSGIITYNFVP